MPPTQSPDFLEAPGRVVVLKLDRSFSDGDQSRWPREDKYGRPDDTLYREKLAKMWLHKNNIALVPGLLFPLLFCQCFSFYNTYYFPLLLSK